MLKLVSPNQPDSQQLWGQSTSKPNALSLHEQAPLVGYWVRVRVRVGVRAPEQIRRDRAPDRDYAAAHLRLTLTLTLIRQARLNKVNENG